MNKKIEKILQTAYNNVPYYNNIINNTFTDGDFFSKWEENFQKIPITTKENIRSLGISNFINMDFLDDNFNFIHSDDIHYEHTSGTTGTQMSVVWKKNEYSFSTVQHWALRTMNADVYPMSRCCTVLYDDIEDFFIIDGNELLLNRRKLTYNSAVKFLRCSDKFDPEWIFMPASVLMYLVFVAKKENIRFGRNVRYIEVFSEPILKYYREIIEDYFGFKVYDMYGCQETNGIAYECKRGHLHVMEDNVHLEILDKNNHPCLPGIYGNVCVTGLFNTLMPMIRYKLNDIARISDMTCTCGNHSPMIELKSCRFPEIMLFDNEKIFSEGVIYYPLRRFSDVSTENEVTFSLHYLSPGRYTIKFHHAEENQIGEYALLFQKIMNAYGVDNIGFVFEKADIVENTYRFGVIKRNKNE